MNLFSRGEVIITQKEAKGEYGKEGNWFWHHNSDYGKPAEYGNQALEPHVFDAANSNEIPARTSNFGKTYGYCTASGEIAITNGELLMSGIQMVEQKSCTPNTGNVGNYYDWVAAVAGDNVPSGEASDSICPKGWQLPKGGDENISHSFGKVAYVYNNYSNVYTGDEVIRKSAAAFIYGGMYSYVMNKRYYESTGSLWTCKANEVNENVSYYFTFDASKIIPERNYEKSFGTAVRCVAR